MFDWIRKIIKKKEKSVTSQTKPVDLTKRWRYAPDGITKINVDDD